MSYPHTRLNSQRNSRLEIQNNRLRLDPPEIHYPKAHGAVISAPKYSCSPRCSFHFPSVVLHLVTSSSSLRNWFRTAPRASFRDSPSLSSSLSFRIVSTTRVLHIKEARHRREGTWTRGEGRKEDRIRWVRSEYAQRGEETMCFETKHRHGSIKDGGRGRVERREKKLEKLRAPNFCNWV